MPATQPVVEIESIEDPIVQAYARAWARVTKLQQAIIDDPAKWHRSSKLQEAKDAIVASMDELDIDTSSWLKGKFPQVYAMGGAAGSAEAGGPASFVWSQISQQAVQDMAQDLFDDLLASTGNVRDSTKTMVRAVMRDEALAKAIIGDTAQNASKQATKLLESKGVKAIIYKDGSSHGLDEYSKMAIRTKTATAFNNGALTGAEARGINYWEVFDGPFCGWAFHDDSIAMGRVVTKDEALSYPIAHPNCRRAFGARPDITNKKQAKDETKNGGSTTTGQRQAQIDQDESRLDDQRRARNSQARSQRRQANRQTGSSRQDKLNQRRERLGDLDMTPPSPYADLMMPADAYADLKSVSDLIAEGWSPGDAAKEFKRLKANAASKLSKQKAKLAKTDASNSGATAKTSATAPVAAGANPEILGNYYSSLNVDTLNYIPCGSMNLGSSQYMYEMKAGIATRRDGITYILETKPGSVVSPAQIAKLEKAVTLQKEALLEAGTAQFGTTKKVIITNGRNPADAYWAKEYKRPGFKSAATGGKGTVTFWNNDVTVGTLRHEAGHNVDHGVAKLAGYGSEDSAWQAAIKADRETSKAFTTGNEWTGNGFKEPEAIGQHPVTMGGKSVSEYGGCSSGEDFAESFRLYLRDRADGRLGIMPVEKNWATMIATEAYDVRFVDAFPERAKIFDKITGNTPVPRSDFSKVAKAPGLEIKGVKLNLALDAKRDVYGNIKAFDANGVNVGYIKEVEDSSSKTGWSFDVRDVNNKLISSGDSEKTDALLRLQVHLGSSAKKVEAKVHVAGKIELKAAAEFPGHDAARKSLPKNVQASIASKKSNFKKAALASGKSADEATALGLAAEKDEVFKRWNAMRGEGSATKGLKAAEAETQAAAEKATKLAADYQKAQDELKLATLRLAREARDKVAKEIADFNKKAAEDIAKRAASDLKKAAAEAAKLSKTDVGVISSEMLQEDVDAAKSFMSKASKVESAGGYSSAAEQAKSLVAKDLAERLDNETDWNRFRDYKAAISPMPDGSKMVMGFGIEPDNAEKLLAYLEIHPGHAKGMLQELAWDPRMGQMVLGTLGLPMTDLEKYVKLATMWDQKLIKPGFAKAINHPSGLPDFNKISAANRRSLLDGEVSERISQWAASSGDSHRASVMMQMAVKDEFGLEGNAFVRASAKEAGVIREDYVKAGDWYRRFARVQYENTQAKFAEEGITHVYVHRGMGFTGKIPEWSDPGIHELKLQPMNSWSGELEIAEDFANGSEAGLASSGKVSERVFAARVPVSRIIGTPRTGWGCLHEAEYVVMQTPGFAKVSHTTKFTDAIKFGGEEKYDPNW